MSEAPHSLRLKSLHADYDIEDIDIRPFVEQVRADGIAGLDPKLDPKIRRNVLTVLVTEDFWDNVENLEADSPETFGLPQEDADVLMTLVEQEKLPLVIKGLRTATNKHLKLCSEICDYFPDPIVEELKQLSFSDPFGKVRCPYPDRFEAGIENANMMGWESIHQLPYLFKREFPTESLSTNRYQEIASRNIAFLRQLAAGHMLIFSAAHNSGRFNGFPGFSPTFLRLVGKKESLHMELAESLAPHIELYREEIQNSIATGCPALVAKSIDGKDIVTAMYEWIRRIADKFFFPHVQKILSRSDISEMWAITELMDKARATVSAKDRQ